MELVRVTKENLEEEHICCAISNNKDCQVASKKAWLSEAFDQGLVFLKGNVRGKCFIEYIPAENAWAPVEAPGYMYIDCLWVSGQFKGQGNSSILLDECIRDSKAKGKKGLVILTSDKKRPFLADPKFLKYKGFVEADEQEPFFKLFYLSFEEDASVPCFKKNELNMGDRGLKIFYANQCPFNEKYVPLIANIAKERGVKLEIKKYSSAKEAQNGPCPFASFSFYKDGEFVTNETLSEKKFLKYLDEWGM